MAPFIILLFLLSEAASKPHVLTVHPGDDVTLPCQAADVPISVVEWSRPDLEPEYVLLNIDGHLQTKQHNPSFKDRVELVDRELKDGDVSLILKNVNSYDSGIYECRAASLGLRRKKRAFLDSEPIRTIRLQVPEPAGHPIDENTMIDGNFPRGYIGFDRPLLTNQEPISSSDKSQSSLHLIVFSCVVYTTYFFLGL